MSARAEQVFSAEELAVLRDHGFAFFDNRVIFDAQPPIESQVLETVRNACAGPIPEQLLELWAITAGGSLDYDLRLTLGGGNESVDWCELFYEGSDRYRDLPGWIAYERELAEEFAEQVAEQNADQGAEQGIEPLTSKLRFLPIGGFEYLTRIYLYVGSTTEIMGDTTGENRNETQHKYGSVIAWKYGLPPAWTHRLHDDSSATLAASLKDAFAMMRLSVDPRQSNDYASGTTFLEYVDERCEDFSLDRVLAGRLIDFYVASAILEWRPLLQNGSIRNHPNHRDAAIRHAIDIDDVQVIEELAALGEVFDEPLYGTARPLDIALGSNAQAVTRALLRSGAKATEHAFMEVRGDLPIDITRLLLSAGAVPYAEAAVHVAGQNGLASAQIIAQAMQPDDDYVRRLMIDDAKSAKLLALRDQLEKVRANELHHHLGEEGLEATIRALEMFSG
jgi:hypothetical protein